MRAQRDRADRIGLVQHGLLAGLEKSQRHRESKADHQREQGEHRGLDLCRHRGAAVPPRDADKAAEFGGAEDGQRRDSVGDPRVHRV
jgi:hypothetical protein